VVTDSNTVAILFRRFQKNVHHIAVFVIQGRDELENAWAPLAKVHVIVELLSEEIKVIHGFGSSLSVKRGGA
jgi:hypothetical protein